ncbi:MAG: hydroxymethylbilane synthase, partial [Nitrosomonas sp.]
ECLDNRPDLVRLMEPLHDRETAQCVEAERAMSRVLGGSCQVPLGGFAQITDNVLTLRGFVATPDGKRIVSDELNGKPESGATLGEQLAQNLMAQGADKILAALVVS